MEEWSSPEQIANFRANQYKTGHKPWQTKSNGAISVRKDKNGHIYKYIRISESRWEMLSRHVWKKHHGAIPAGHNIQFKDGDSLNCDISNLYLISRSDQLRTENSLMARYPKDIRIAIQAKGALYRQINKLKSKEDEHEHDKD